ncbi:MAG: hypothetical protein IJJ59_02685 [Pseudobutyrivibrio sp.]|uniref:DUF6731 family protein n=1 Tax=Pseudobutyrivibrio sp. TaxID=2014367 RepID=UPI0025D3CA3B|nr:DUF6731 family protein [Pseudobutyrivibrio sp.]MBQ6462212.1 hypothetical protein [Pseudobutyrivibrio sp.]
MAYIRTARFQYYQIIMYHLEVYGRKKKKVVDKQFEFSKWALKMKENDMIQKAIDFKGVKARIERIGIENETSCIWGLRLLKLRDKNIPAKARDKVDAVAVELEEGEYIGEDLFMIFDEDASIAMIQQNRMALGVSRVEEFFSHTYKKYVDPEYEGYISIEPIAEQNKKNRLKKGNYRQIEISFANVKDYADEDNKQALTTILNPVKKLYGTTGTIKIGLGRTKNDTLNKTEILALVDELQDLSNKRFIRSARIKLQEEEDSDVEIIDLFEENCHDFIDFTLEDRELLDYTYAIGMMRACYKKRKRELCKYTNQKE